MSVLIKEMEMPINCYECRFGCWPSDGSRPYCILTDEDADEPDYCSKRMAHCHLVPVPPHGRLIDADKLKEEFPHDEDWDYPVNTNSYVVEIIDKSPTIIEAEEGE